MAKAKITKESDMSETKHARPILSQYCTGMGLDIGFGGDAIVPTAITFDQPKPYCPSLAGHTQILRGSCKDLSMFCDCSLDYIYSSHLIEDFYYKDIIPMLLEWRRVLKIGGLLVTNCPDQQKFLAHCAKTGQQGNAAHKEQDFSLANFKSKILTKTGPWEEVFVQQEAGPYSWYLVVRKTEPK
jgi:hypothetical protein